MSELLGTAGMPRQRRLVVRSVLGNGARLMGINCVETVMGLAYFAIMARFLGPELYGRWAYGVAAYALVVGLAGFGLDPLIIMRLGRDKEGAGAFLGLTLTLRLVLLFLGAVGLGLYALAAEPDPLSRLVLLLLIPALVGRGVAVGVRIYFVAYERIAEYVQFVALFRCAEAACGLAYLAAGGGLIGVIVLHALFWLGEASFGIWRIRSRLTSFALRFEWGPASDLLAQGAVLALSIAGYTWLTTGPVTMLRHSTIDMAQLGQFAIVANLGTILVASAYAFLTAVLPVLSRSTQSPGAGMAYARITALAALAAAAGAAWVGEWLGPPTVEWMLGARYAIAGSLLAAFILICGVILAPAAYWQILVVSGRRWPVALADLAGAACLLVVFAPSVADWGLDGAVLATGASWFVRAVLQIGMAEAQALRTPHATPKGVF